MRIPLTPSRSLRFGLASRHRGMLLTELMVSIPIWAVGATIIWMSFAAMMKAQTRSAQFVTTYDTVNSFFDSFREDCRSANAAILSSNAEGSTTSTIIFRRSEDEVRYEFRSGHADRTVIGIASAGTRTWEVPDGCFTFQPSANHINGNDHPSDARLVKYGVIEISISIRSRPHQEFMGPREVAAAFAIGQGARS